jgi:glycosyltransferase involved in cell wall biosynthesis
VETALLNWIQTMDPFHFETHLFCFANPGHTEEPFMEAASARGIQVRTIPWSRRKPVWRAARLLAASLEASGVQVLHCHNTYADVVGVLTSKVFPVKTVTTLYVWGKFGFVRGALQLIDRLLLPCFDQVTAHCQETLQGTINRRYPAERLRLLQCGFQSEPVHLSEADRSAGRQALGAADEDFVLINVARFYPEKAHDVLLQGFQIVLKQRPRARLWLLGVGPTMEKTRRLSERLELGESVTFLGFRADLAKTLVLADMQVHASDVEGVPLAICAGMAAGLPIVATRVGGLGEVLRDAVSGSLVEKQNPGQFAQAVLDLMANPEKRASLGSAAKRFIEEEYSLKAATRRVEKVYEELVRN